MVHVQNIPCISYHTQSIKWTHKSTLIESSFARMIRLYHHQDQGSTFPAQSQNSSEHDSSRSNVNIVEFPWFGKLGILMVDNKANGQCNGQWWYGLQCIGHTHFLPERSSSLLSYRRRRCSRMTSPWEGSGVDRQGDNEVWVVEG